jgi:prepilin-type N-terminal cleavage/methylation domain-containing protein
MIPLLHTPIKRKPRGFTLIETFVAVTILAFAVAGPLFAASRAYVAASIARDQLTASYLAQEGIEYVRAMRDNSYLRARSTPITASCAWSTTGQADVTCAAWNIFTDDQTYNSSIAQCKTTACSLNPHATGGMGTGSGFTLQTCSGTCPTLYLLNGQYSTTASGTQTPFTRSVQVTEVSETEVRVTSTVSWSFHSRTYTVNSIDHLTPWQ